jgi:hypothetical protein
VNGLSEIGLRVSVLSNSLNLQLPQSSWVGKSILVKLIEVQFQMDTVYFFIHSKNDDFELRQSLRSIEQHAPYIRKVWIFGDRPSFISDDVSIVEHVPEKYMAPLLRVKTPVRNFFLLAVLSSLIPELEFEYLRFSDDFFLLKDYPIEEARKYRYLEDLTPDVPPMLRGKGKFRESLWRTRDALVRLGYTAYNFETHTPMYTTRQRVLEAYRDLGDFVTEDRWYGLVGMTAILNHALKKERDAGKTPELICLKNAGNRGGFWGKTPSSYEAVLQEVEGKTFLNFDDLAFGGIARFLQERFPTPSRFEKPQAAT